MPTANTQPTPDAEAQRRIDRLEESIELIAQFLAQGRDVTRLRRAVGKLSPVGDRLVDVVMEFQAERAGRAS